MFRLTNSPESECVFPNNDEAGQVIATFPYELSDDPLAFTSLRNEVLKQYKVLYPLRSLDEDSLFAHTHKNSLKVLHVCNMATLAAHVHKQEKSIRLAMGAEHSEAAPEGGYPIHEGFLLPPVKPADIKGAVAIAEHELETKVAEAVKTLYFNESSPLYNAINAAHVPFIKTFLRQKSSSKILEDLTGGKAIFHSQNVDDFVQKSIWSGGWANPELMHQCHSIPAKGRYPPDLADKGPPKIPQLDFKKVPSGSGGSSNNSSSSSSSSGTTPSISTGDGLALVAAAIRPPDSSGGGGKLLSGLDSSNILKYESWDNFKTKAGLTAADALLMESSGWNDLDVLTTLVESVLGSNPTNFLSALKDQLSSKLTLNGVTRLVTAMKKDPTAAPG